MSSDKPSQPEFFFDRNLGKVTARRLREHGWTIHLIAEFYDDDAEDVSDEEWIAEGCQRGWALITKDKKIRSRAAELGALTQGHLFCLPRGDLSIDEMVRRFLEAEAAIARAVESCSVGFWHVYAGGHVKKMWPAPTRSPDRGS